MRKSKRRAVVVTHCQHCSAHNLKLPFSASTNLYPRIFESIYSSRKVSLIAVYLCCRLSTSRAAHHGRPRDWHRQGKFPFLRPPFFPQGQQDTRNGTRRGLDSLSVMAWATGTVHIPKTCHLSSPLALHTSQCGVAG